LRDAYQSFRSMGATVAAIGLGSVEEAAQFRNRYDLPFPLLVDRSKKTYKALGTGRSALRAAGPRVWWSGATSILAGHGQAVPRQDWRQLGGAAVIEPGGKIRVVHRSKTASDNLAVSELLAALEKQRR
jgi:hypothetical protein